MVKLAIQKLPKLFMGTLVVVEIQIVIKAAFAAVKQVMYAWEDVVHVELEIWITQIVRIPLHF